MPFNRISAMGVEHGQVSPEDQFVAQRTDAMRRAQMAALMASGGGQSGGGTPASQGFEPYQQKEPEIIGNTGTPYAPIDMMNRQVKAGMDMQGLQGSQALELQKQRGADSLALGNVQMGAANKRADLDTRMYDDSAGVENARRAMQSEALKKASGLIGGGQAPSTNSLVGGGGGSAVGGQGKWDEMAALSALANGGQMPDFASRDIQRKTLEMGLEDRKRQLGSDRVQSFLDAGDVEGANTAGATAGVPVPKQNYGTAVPQMKGDIDRVSNFIRSNNWSIAGNQAELKSLYDSTMKRAQSLNLSPQALTLVEQDLKNAMRDALKENGVFFQAAGSDTTRQNFGL